MPLLTTILALGLVAVLTGCGGTEKVETMSPEDFVEAIPEEDSTAAKEEVNAEMTDSTESDNGSETSGTSQPTGKTETSGVSQSTGKTETSGVSQPTGKTKSSGTSEPIGETKEVKEISVSALQALADTENLTEEKRKELLVQALEDAGKDPALVEGKIKTKGLYFEVPENFAPSENNPDMYVTKRYSLDISNIYYREAEADYMLQLMTEESYKEMALKNFKETYAMDVNLQIDSYKETKISGIPSFEIKSHFDLEGVTLEQTTFIINADKTYLLVYTTSNEYETGQAFPESMASIRVEK